MNCLSCGHVVFLSFPTAASQCGENIFMATNKKSWDMAVQEWYDEVKNFRYGVGAVHEKTVGHFTQVQLHP